MQPFRVLTYRGQDGGERVGVLLAGDQVMDLARGLDQCADRHPDWASGGMLDVLRHWDEAFPMMAQAAEKCGQAGKAAPGVVMPLSGVNVLAPLRNPGKMIIVGINYIGHIQEMLRAFFNEEFDPKHVQGQAPILQKLPSCIIGTGDYIELPPESQKVDFEVELVVVIGARARRVAAADAHKCIAGYSIMNDVSARDLLPQDGYAGRWFGLDIFACKSYDTFGPFGPCILPQAFAGNPPALNMRLTINGEQMQNANTRDMIWGVPALIERISKVVTLEPGDIISTGTPEGVGMPRPRFLNPGDVVECEIEGIGKLRNPVRRA